jgi:hypothetical protein
MRKVLALIGVVGGALLYFTRRRRSTSERVHLYYDDGSMVTLEHSAPQTERLLALARAAL